MQQSALFDMTDDCLPLRNGITITGSRQVATDNLDILLATALGRFVGQQRVWLIGGAIGIDQFAAEWLLGKQEQVVAVVPFLVRDQPQAVRDVLARVGRCVELGLPRSKKAYLDRNAFMVDRSDVVIAFWNGEKGGTSATIQHAMKCRREVHVYPVDGA
jgi:predicted Rossmann fold nucleotide-binding protein DprA/Smf involved in DNA uptake